MKIETFDIIQVETKETVLKELEVKFPIYSVIEEQDCYYYTKLDIDKFTQIKVGLTSTEIMSWKSNNRIIPELWIKNNGTKEDWDTIVESTKKQLEDF